MQMQVGWSLVRDTDGVVVQYWGDTYGEYVSLPDYVDIPGIGRVHCPSENGLAGTGYTIYPRMMDRPHPTAADVKKEAQRRIIELTGSATLSECIIKQLNASMRATQIVNKKAEGRQLTEQEKIDVEDLEKLAAAIARIRLKSNEIESTLPLNYTEDSKWV